MNEQQSFERRAKAWLDLGPTAAPQSATEAVFAAIENVPQERPLLRLPGRTAPVGWQARFAIAAAVVIAIVVLSAIALRLRPTDVATTPPPNPTSLLNGYPAATVRFEKSGGPTVAGGRIEIGTVAISRRSLLAYSCAGAPDGSLKIELLEPGASAPWTEINGPCGGTIQYHQLNPGSVDGPLTAWITVPAGASWRVAIGEYSESLSTVPSFAPLTPTDGWTRVYELEPTLAGAEQFGAGVMVNVPANATLVAVSAQCAGDAKLTFLLDQVPQGEARPCRGPDVTERIELHVAGGARVPVSVKAEGLAWIHYVVEVNGDPETAMPSAPPMPAALAATGWAEANMGYLALGTLGANTQSVSPLEGRQPGSVGGDLVAVAVPTATGMRLDLWSTSTASVIGTLAQAEAPDWFDWSSVDVTHEQVFYSIRHPDSTDDWHRVAFDGSADKVVATSWTDPELLSLIPQSLVALAVDDSVFVVEFCDADKICRRPIVDAASGESRIVTLTGEPPCQVLGIADGLVVAVSWPTCDFMAFFASPPPPMTVTATPLDGGESRVLTSEAEFPVLIPSSIGAQLVWVSEVSERERPIEALDIASGARRHLTTVTLDPPQVMSPSSLRLPPDWVLLAGPLGNFPTGGLAGPVPLLLNVVTGEQIELVNLRQPTP